MKRNYYAVLGVEPRATFEAIKRAYCRIALTCHPDRGGSNGAMALLNEAWSVLSDPQKRERYDRARARRATAGPKPKDAKERIAVTCASAPGSPSPWSGEHLVELIALAVGIALGLLFF